MRMLLPSVMAQISVKLAALSKDEKSNDASTQASRDVYGDLYAHHWLNRQLYCGDCARHKPLAVPVFARVHGFADVGAGCLFQIWHTAADPALGGVVALNILIVLGLFLTWMVWSGQI